MKNLILLLFILTATSISCKKEITKPIEYGSGKDYVIYEKVLQSKFAETDFLIILNDYTAGEFLDSLHTIIIKEKIPALLEETLIDYTSKNSIKVKLKNIPNIKSLVFRSEISTKPENSVEVWLSNIGYDNSETQAVVTIGIIYGPLACDGILYFLTNEKGEWNIKDGYRLWIC